MLEGIRDHHQTTYVNDFLQNKEQIENVSSLKKQRKRQPKSFTREQSIGPNFPSQNNLPNVADRAVGAWGGNEKRPERPKNNRLTKGPEEQLAPSLIHRQSL